MRSLPYDYARCVGRDWPECVDCLRRLSPDRPNGWQTYQVPPERRPHPAWRCDARIARDAIDAARAGVYYLAMTTDRIEQATRIIVRTCGRDRAYFAGQNLLTLHGYNEDEINEAIRLWRVWKRGMRELESRRRCPS